MIESIFIIALLILSNYTDQTLPTQVHKYVLSNIVVKQLIVLALVYYSVKQWGSQINHDLPKKMGVTLLIWIGYLLIIKCRINIVAMCIVILFGIFIVNDIKLYLEHHHETKHVIYGPVLDAIHKLLLGFLGVTMVYGITTSNYRFRHNNLLYNLMDHNQ
jgi:hypothetical protein